MEGIRHITLNGVGIVERGIGGEKPCELTKFSIHRARIITDQNDLVTVKTAQLGSKRFVD